MVVEKDDLRSVPGAENSQKRPDDLTLSATLRTTTTRRLSVTRRHSSPKEPM